MISDFIEDSLEIEDTSKDGVSLIDKTILEEFNIDVQGYDKFLNKLSNLEPHSRIAIVDDVDCDGVMSTYITKSILSQRFKNVEVVINTGHGLTDLKEEVKSKNYDMVIIVDSSSNLASTYYDLKQTIIIDHHMYDKEKIKDLPDNVLLLNSKDNEITKSISAGMFCFLLFEQFAKDTNLAIPENLFGLGVVSLYSDIVPLDDFVKALINIFIKDLKQNKVHPLISDLNMYKGAINKGVISFGISPTVNYTRKLQDERTLKLLYRDCMSIASINLKKNSDYVKNTISLIVNQADIKEYENFIYTEIDGNKYPDMVNFKGLIANMLHKTYNLPAKVGFKDTKNDVLEVSIRSNGYDSYSFIKNNNLNGGGHKPACGYKINPDQLEEMLDKYNEYLEDKHFLEESNIQILTIKEIENHPEGFLKTAKQNEFRFSCLKPIKYRTTITKSQIESIDYLNKKFSIGKTQFTMYDVSNNTLLEDATPEQELTLTFQPTMDSHILNTHILVAEIR